MPRLLSVGVADSNKSSDSQAWKGADVLDRTRFLGDRLWSLGFAAFFAAFFVVPDVSSSISKLMVLAAAFMLLRRPIVLREVRWEIVLLFLLPLLIYLFSMSLHEWNHRQMGRPLHMAYAVLILLALRQVDLDLKYVLHGVSAALAIGLCVAMHERFTLDAARVFGPLSGADFGNYAAPLAVGLVLGAIRQGTSPVGAINGELPNIVRLQYFLAAISGLMMAIWSGSRSSLLIIVLSIPLLALVDRRRKSSPLFVPVGLGAVGLLGFSAWNVFHERILSMYRETMAFFLGEAAAYQSTSTGIRWESIRIGVDLCSEHPALGMGINAFKRYARALAEAGTISDEIPSFFGMLHNQFLDACVLLGLPGVLLLLLFWLFMFRVCYACLKRTSTPYAHTLTLILAAVSIGYFVSSTTGSMFSSTKGTVFICVCWTLLLYLYANSYPGALYRASARAPGRSASFGRM